MDGSELFIGRWKVYFLFDVDKSDIEDVSSILTVLEASDDILDRTEEVLESGRLDTGFTFTNPDIYRALVVIGRTSSGEEFIDTLVHEVHHLAVAIATNIGIDLESETPAYLAGDTARELAGLICRMGCDRCNN